MSGSNPLGIYIHIPFCAHKCAYCDFVSGNYDAGIQQRYISALLSEIKERGAVLHGGRYVDTVFFGGGTPSMLPAQVIPQILNVVRQTFLVDTNPEITVECNPECLDAEKLASWYTAGVNRISLGVQSLHDGELAWAGRIHDRQVALAAIDLVRQSGFTNVNCDLILGLQGQTRQSLGETMACLMDKNIVSHISVYGLKVEKGTPLAAQGFHTDEDGIAERYDQACAFLHDEGFHRYEISNYSVSDMQCRHNLKYWKLQEYAGFGVAAHSQIGDTRGYNTGDITQYCNDGPYHRLEALSLWDRTQEYIMLGLRLDGGICLEQLKHRFGYDLLQAKKQKILPLLDKGVLRLDQGKLSVAPQFFYVQNSVLTQIL